MKLDSKIDETLPVIRSAGVLLRCGELYLIAHPTAGTGGTRGWGIPKGKIDPGETPYAGALREFQEETNLDLLNNRYDITVNPDCGLNYIAKISKKANKEFFVFLAEAKNDAIINHGFSCPSLLDDGRPEIATYQWVDIYRAYDICAVSQKALFGYFLNEQSRITDKEAIQDMVDPSVS